MENQENIENKSAKIGEKEISKAQEIMNKYKEGKTAYTQKIVNAEEWWKSKHWERFQNETGNENDPKPVSAWLFNSIINKHADFMDNMPCPAILPREKSDENTAKLLTQVIPKILEQNEFENTYSDCCWDKPKVGTGVYGVFWNREKENGLGDIEIKAVDIINLFWEPGISNIQMSKNIFSVDIVDREILLQEYPSLKGKNIESGMIYKPEYIYESNLDTSEKVQVIDWYYKRKVRRKIGEIETVQTILHYCKFIQGHVLYASENDVEMEMGWYKDGKYPFVYDRLFPEKGMPVGFGYIDVMVCPQEYIDKLDQIILKNASLQRPRYFAKTSVGMNLSDFTDLSKDIIEVTGNVDETALRPITAPQMSDIVMTAREMKIEELKETSGNRDFSQGSTTSGVTAASAIAALQEAGSKLSRDMIKGTYKAYSEVITMVIERIRQFYDLPRCYRITQPNGAADYIEMTNKGLAQVEQDMMDGISVRKPVFDISVSAQKASPYSRIANNELAKELYGMGVFNPSNADQAAAVISMMDFDKKDEIMQKISQNGLLYQQMQQMMRAMQQMATVIAESTGDTRLIDGVSQLLGGKITQDSTSVGQISNQNEMIVNSLGEAKKRGKGKDEQARERVARSTGVSG